MAVTPRCEMDSAFQWDLTAIFPTREAFEAELSAVMAQVEPLKAVFGTLGKSADNLKNGLERIFDVYHRFDRVLNYAFLHCAQDNSDPAARDMQERAIAAATLLETATAPLRPEILAADPEILREALKREDFAPYRRTIGDIVRMRPHTLDANSERMLAQLTDAAGTPDNIYTMFESVDMKFPDLRARDGQMLPLSHGNYSVYRESPDRALRKSAFETYLGSYAEYNATLAATYAGSVKLDAYFANVRGYANALEKSLDENEIPVALYGALLQAVEESLPAMSKYLKLRAQALKLDDLHMYDLYVPMVEDVDMSITYPEACALVLKALAPLGEDYVANVKRAIDERWIDVYENKGKTTGAFSCGVFDAHPYVLMNFSGKLHDAFTLAHELGHAMHSFSSDRTQAYPDHEYTLFVAEVASTVNEMLLSEYLLATVEDEKLHAYVLNHLLEGFRTTIYRQVLFAEFERDAHAIYENGGALTETALNECFLALDKKYYPGVTVDDFMGVEWSVVPHFYRAYYVYQYATGFASAVALSQRILRENGRDDYLRFLSLGGSLPPIEELKIAGVDLTTTAPVRDALNVFSRRVDDLADALGIPRERLM